MKDIYGRVHTENTIGPTPGEVEVPAWLRQVGYAWHDGQSSPLYSMASVGSIATGLHQTALLRELTVCLDYAVRNPRRIPRADLLGLYALYGFVGLQHFPPYEDSR